MLLQLADHLGVVALGSGDVVQAGAPVVVQSEEVAASAAHIHIQIEMQVHMNEYGHQRSNMLQPSPLQQRPEHVDLTADAGEQQQRDLPRRKRRSGRRRAERVEAQRPIYVHRACGR
jgi:hypothetical protein